MVDMNAMRDEVTGHVLARSFRARIEKKRTARIVRVCLNTLRTIEDSGETHSDEQLRALLLVTVKRDAESNKVGFISIALTIIGILAPIIIKLVMNWWQKRQDKWKVKV